MNITFLQEPKQLGFFAKKPYRPILHLLTPEIKAAFWRNVDVADQDDCWPWLGSKSPAGYGLFVIAKATFVASRVSITISSKLDYIDFMALHSCDNPPCCNPNHLFCGNNQINTNDKRAKGRFAGKGGLPENMEKATLARESYNKALEARLALIGRSQRNC